MAKKIKKAVKAVKAWDKRNTTFHSSTYMLLFVTSSMAYLSLLQQAIVNIKVI
ncbi:MAG: hypothetical protein LBQ59_00020 [Candidatus Peribacteria bacterium]|jgi:hypothetical protein|nr:hypothetical protein [Candidatus Peribacteria bacterium]